MCAVRSRTAPSVPKVFAHTWNSAQTMSTAVNSLSIAPVKTRVRLS